MNSHRMQVLSALCLATSLAAIMTPSSVVLAERIGRVVNPPYEQMSAEQQQRYRQEQPGNVASQPSASDRTWQNSQPNPQPLPENSPPNYQPPSPTTAPQALAADDSGAKELEQMGGNTGSDSITPTLPSGEKSSPDNASGGNSAVGSGSGSGSTGGSSSGSSGSSSPGSSGSGSSGSMGGSSGSSSPGGGSTSGGSSGSSGGGSMSGGSSGGTSGSPSGSSTGGSSTDLQSNPPNASSGTSTTQPGSGEKLSSGMSSPNDPSAKPAMAASDQSAQAAKSAPGSVIIEEPVVFLLANEPQEHLIMAQDQIQHNNYPAAAQELQISAAYLDIQASRANSTYRTSLSQQAQQLRSLAQKFLSGQQLNPQQVQNSFAQVNLALAQHFQARADQDLQFGRQTAAGYDLRSAAISLQQAMAWSSQQANADQLQVILQANQLANQMIAPNTTGPLAQNNANASQVSQSLQRQIQQCQQQMAGRNVSQPPTAAEER